jgi:hypothetical protein
VRIYESPFWDYLKAQKDRGGSFSVLVRDALQDENFPRWAYELETMQEYLRTRRPDDEVKAALRYLYYEYRMSIEAKMLKYEGEQGEQGNS